MTENAKRVYEIAKKHDLDILLESAVNDLDEFAEGIDTDNEQEVITQIYNRIDSLI